MAQYEARLTAAGFLGDLQVDVDGSAVKLRGARASQQLLVARLVGQWLLAATGIVGLTLEVPGSGWVLFSAPVYSLVMYLWLWWDSTDQEVTIAAGEQTEAEVGAAFRWYDMLWLLNALTAIAMIFTAASLGKRTVSFRGPGRSAGKSVRYLVLASDPKRAIALTAQLLGMDALRDGQRSG